MRPRLVGLSARVSGVLMLAAMFAFITSCNDTTGPRTSPNTIEARWDGGVLKLGVLGSSAATGTLELVAQSFEFDATSEVLSAEVAVHNAGNVTVPGPGSVVVYGFVPANVAPLDAGCANGECTFDHSGTYGDDGVLAPGETSTPVMWRLSVPGGESFAFHARVGGVATGPGTISGVVFDDSDRDGTRDSGETGVASVQVQLRAGGTTETQATDATGVYAFQVTSAGLYSIQLAPGQQRAATTELPLQIAIVQSQDSTLSSFTAGDIGLAPNDTTTMITVEGYAWADLDRDGQRGEDEPGLANVKVKAKACSQKSTVNVQGGHHDEFVTRTDAFGHYTLQVRDCPSWEIRGGSVNHYDRTTPRIVVLDTLSAESTVLNADFGYAPEDPSSRYEICGVVFQDDDGDGVRDANEPRLADVRVTAMGIDCTGPAGASDVTNRRGHYSLDGEDVACPLPWRVERAAIPGMIDTTPAVVQLDAPPARWNEYEINFGVQPQP